MRMALGARRAQVCATILWRALALVMAGLGVGLMASVATSRLIADQLWNTSPHDPLTIAVAVAVIVVQPLPRVRPTRRAMRVEPMIALRRD